MLARGHQLGEGYGELKRSTFRIGHMGDHTEVTLAQMLSIADDVIRELS
jgi:aspartate aminotransferase-like enzyme